VHLASCGGLLSAPPTPHIARFAPGSRSFPRSPILLGWYTRNCSQNKRFWDDVRLVENGGRPTLGTAAHKQRVALIIWNSYQAFVCRSAESRITLGEDFGNHRSPSAKTKA